MPVRNHLFIVTYGRTGSTLLQAILNSHPQIRILGEKAGLPYHLYRCLQSLAAFENHRGAPEGDTPSNPFFGVTDFPFDEVRAELTGRFDCFLPPVDQGFETRGFKEVRYDQPDLDNYLDFLYDRFENACFVFLTRAHDAVLGSGFFSAADPDLFHNYLTILDQRFHGYALRKPDRSFELTYSELLDFERISELFAFLGHEASEADWRTVLTTKHSYAQRSVVELGAYSQFVFFDSAKKLIEAWKVDDAINQMKNISMLPFAGVLVPQVATGPLESLVLQNGGARHQAAVALPSPAFGRKFPGNPDSKHSRFSFADDPVDLMGTTGDFELVGTFAHAGPQVLGRLFVSGRKRLTE